jgi:hypothetical protein
MGMMVFHLSVERRPGRDGSSGLEGGEEGGGSWEW